MTDNAVTPHEGVWIPDGLEARVKVMQSRINAELEPQSESLWEKVAVAYARVWFYNHPIEWNNCSSCSEHTRMYYYVQDRRTQEHPNADVWEQNLEYHFCYKCIIRRAFSRVGQTDNCSDFDHDDSMRANLLMPFSMFPRDDFPVATQKEPPVCLCGRHIREGDEREGKDSNGKTHIAHSNCVIGCRVCDGWFIISGDYTTTMRMVNGLSHCQACFDTARNENDYSDCERCDEWFDSDDMNWSEARERNLCDRCYRQPVTCYDCDYHYTEGNNHECHREEGDIIYSYSYKPKAKFFGQGKYHLGFELEVEESDGNSDERNYCAGLIEMKLGERVYMKYDGSLDDGFEVVTHPHTLEEYTTNFDWSFLSTLVSNNYVSWNNSNCGFHVHISRTAFDSPKGYTAQVSHKMRFTKFIYDNQYQVERIAGRKANDFATFSDKGAILNKVLNHDQRNGRYEVVNVYNDHTYEIRIFKGSLRKARLLSNLEFVHAVCEYTRNMKVAAKHTPFAWSRFVKFVTDNDTQYPNLMLIIDEAFASERIRSEV